MPVGLFLVVHKAKNGTKLEIENFAASNRRPWCTFNNSIHAH